MNTLSIKDTRCVAVEGAFNLVVERANSNNLSPDEAEELAQNANLNLARVLGGMCGLLVAYDPVDRCYFLDTCTARICPMDAMLLDSCEEA